MIFTMRRCIKTLFQRFQTTLPGCIWVKVMGRSTSHALLTNILKMLGEEPKRQRETIQQLSLYTATAIERNYLRFIILDEGDQLRGGSFEAGRSLLDKGECPLLLVGLAKVLTERGKETR